MKYPIAVTRKKGRFFVFCPDISELVTARDDEEEAKEKFARELELHFAKLAAKNIPLPKSSYQSGDFVENKFVDQFNWYCDYSDRYQEKMGITRDDNCSI